MGASAVDRRRKWHAHPFIPERSSATNWRRSASQRKNSPKLSTCRPTECLYQLLAGKRNVAADTALRLSQKYFGMSADFLDEPSGAKPHESWTLRGSKPVRPPRKLRRFLTETSGSLTPAVTHIDSSDEANDISSTFTAN